MKDKQSKENKKTEVFKFTYNKISGSQIKYHFLKSDGDKLTYEELISLLKEKDVDFLKEFWEALNHATDELSAYFWECAPVSQNSLDKEFGFVVTKSKIMNDVEQDYSSFREHINKVQNDYVTSFSNLGKDATLIVPVPQKSNDEKMLDYKNISQFAKNSLDEQ